jgi:urea carboxylase
MARYSFGGDEHLCVEMDQSMSLRAFFKALGVCNAVRSSGIKGIVEVCPANASMLLKFDPEIIKPPDVEAEIRKIEAAIEGKSRDLPTRLIELPVYFNDPWSHETMMRFRDRHQDPNSTDLEFAARVNDLPSGEAFIDAYAAAPWFCTMVGFVPGTPWLYQMVKREKQLQVPKYVRPRTDTPKQTVSHGGCFSAIYPVRGPGGYQCFGITPVPMFDATQKTKFLKNFTTLFRPGDVVKYRAIERKEYDQIIGDIDSGKYEPPTQDITFSIDECEKNPEAYGAKIVEQLHVRN